MEHHERRLALATTKNTQVTTKRSRAMTPAVLLMMLSLLAISACGTMTQQLEQEDAASAETTTQIKARLVEAESVDAAAVRVELRDSVVVLSGFVASEKEALEAVGIAEQEAGQYTVRNELIVKP